MKILVLIFNCPKEKKLFLFYSHNSEKKMVSICHCYQCLHFQTMSAIICENLLQFTGAMISTLLIVHHCFASCWFYLTIEKYK